MTRKVFVGRDGNEKPSHKPKTNERIRYLNVIYFIDSNRTHTFKLSLKHAIVIGSIVLSMLSWSVVGSYFLFTSVQRSEQKSDRIRSLLGTIFNYQIRYDEVYERSYPDQPALPESLAESSEAGATSESAETPLADQGERMSLAAKKAQPAPLTSETSAEKSTAAEPEKQKDRSVQDPPIDIQSIESTIVNEALEFSFALKNLISPELSSGYVIGMADFKEEGGATQTVHSPSNLNPDKKIPISSLSRNHRFSIRYYKKKILTFSKPSELPGEFESVKIIVGDRDGNRKEIVYDLEARKIDSVRTSEGPGIKNVQ